MTKPGPGLTEQRTHAHNTPRRPKNTRGDAPPPSPIFYTCAVGGSAVRWLFRAIRLNRFGGRAFGHLLLKIRVVVH